MKRIKVEYKHRYEMKYRVFDERSPRGYTEYHKYFKSNNDFQAAYYVIRVVNGNDGYGAEYRKVGTDIWLEPKKVIKPKKEKSFIQGKLF